MQDFKELLSDIVVTHAVLQSQVELVAAVEHLLAVVVLRPERGNQSICGQGKKKDSFDHLASYLSHFRVPQAP